MRIKFINRRGLIWSFLSGWLILFPAFLSRAQITAPGYSYSDESLYPVFSGIDPLFIFCAEKGEKVAWLRAEFNGEGPKSWEWQKYNTQNGEYEFFFSENNNLNYSEIGPLEEGGYLINISMGERVVTYRAWVLNSHIDLRADIPESNCQFFTLGGTFEAEPLVYFDPASGDRVLLINSHEAEWFEGNEVISRQLVRQIYDPPTSDTDYRLKVTDRFGCSGEVKVTYRSIVTKASFTADPMKGEAPLTVTFINNSENGTPGQFEWFIFRDLDQIKRESEKSTQPVDSIMEVAYDDAPVYTFERSGSYMVKLVSRNAFCTDTAWLETYIIADTSFVAVPNVFTPNGDGVNDNFVVKFWSMERVKISVFNRWGRVVHVWESNNVRGFKDTWSESVWDGRIGGRPASPGVYFYVIEGTGRDGKKRWKHGDVYLIRGK